VYYTIEFVADWQGDLERGDARPLERVLLSAGTRKRARLRPLVLEACFGPVEVADLFFEDGSVVRGVPFALFAFAD
jgi:hypothetical protein